MFMRHSFILILSFLMLTLCNMQAQESRGKTEYIISGTVTDGEEPLTGVLISILDKPGGGAVTDIDGKFEIKAERGDKLNFSYVGFQKQQYVVMGNKSDLVIRLVSDNKIDEVVVTGLGTQRKISTLSAVTTINAN